MKVGSVGGFPADNGGFNECVGSILISGGGGVGAVANPIFGQDGSLLSCDIVRGGFGYRFPPKATLFDTCRRGAGAVLKLTIGEVAPTVQYFDQEDDFEVYDLTPPSGQLSGYGDRFGVDGENLGEWDPNLYATFVQDPIQREIRDYQDYLAAGINPFWTTRKEKPISVSFRDRNSTVVHEVTHPAWDDNFMDKYAISPTPPSNVPGTDYAGQVATMEWEENFPYTGEYIFKGMADNLAKLFLDNELLFETSNFKGGPKDKLTKTVASGVHKIRIDLFNAPQYEKVKPKPKSPSDYVITYRGLNQGSSNTVSGEKSYAIRTEGESKTAGRRVVNNRKEVQFDDDISNGFDVNASLKIESTSPGVTAKFNSDGTQMIVSGNGDVSLKFSWDDNPNAKGLSVGTLKVGNGEKVSWTTKQRGEKGSDRKTIKVGGNDSKEVIGKGGFTVSKDLKQIKMRDGHGDDINATFSIKSSTNNARFTSDGKKLQFDGDGDVTLKLEWDDNPDKYGVAVETIEVGGVKLTQKGNVGSDTKTLTVKANTSSGSSAGSQGNVTVFNTVDYINKADRKLWRTNVYGRGGFLNEYGICPFNTSETLEDNPYSGTHVIRWSNINFPADGNYLIDVDVDDSVKLFIGNASGNGEIGIGNGLNSVENGGDEVIIQKEGFAPNSNKGLGKSSYTKFFKKGNYRIRAELYQKPGGRFGFDSGSGSSSKITARFVGEGNNLSMVVEGSGTAEIDFSLRMDDNPRNSGDSLSSIRIGKGENDSIVLARTRQNGGFKEKEVITGTARFEAGRTYPIIVNGQSRTAGVRLSSSNSIKFDDNIDNGFDLNGELRLIRLKNLSPAPTKGINPMALAINITSQAQEVLRVSSRSWQDNPMGAAFAIDGPEPPIPQEPPLQSEGRCPNNPIWTTRSPGSSEKWWPVKYNGKRSDGSFSWSKFMNRFATSPIPPLASPNSDGGGGIVYKNSWDLDIPYTGFYGLKGTGDNKGRILIDGQEVYKLKGFSDPAPKIEKVKLVEGSHNIEVEIENFPQRNYTIVKKDIFNTQQWGSNIKEENNGAGSVNVVYRGLSQGSTETVTGEKSYAIRTEGESGTAGRKVTSTGKVVQFDDDINNGFDENARLTIESTSPGVTAKFNGDGTQMIVKGRGDVSLKFEWDDNPNAKGLSVGTLKVGNGEKVSWTTKQKGTKGSDRKTINVGVADTKEVVGKGGYTVSGNKVKMRDGHGDDINSTLSIKSSTVNAKFSSDGKRVEYQGSGKITFRLEWDDNPKNAGVAVESIEIGGKVLNQKGEKGNQEITIDVKGAGTTSGEATTSGSAKNGVTYSGPELFRFNHKRWSDFMNKHNVSPYLPPLNVDSQEVIKDRTMTWKNVFFPESGKYTINFQADNEATLFINGEKATTKKGFVGEVVPTYVDLTAGKYEVKVVVKNAPQQTNTFNSNPYGFALKIIKDIKVFGDSPPWTGNPIGASAIMIPPPCPKEIKGTGVVTGCDILEPGNSYPTPTGGGYPVTLVLEDIITTSPGINYDPEDRVVITRGPNDPIELEIVLDPFGKVTGVKLPEQPLYGFTRYPNITLPSRTGVGFRGRPMFAPVVVPEDVLPDPEILQVTDLVGLKQTGYVNGKPYYGSVFAKDGQLFAGVYETIGKLIPVYATLQESIDAQVTTAPSAILRQGTDVTSNDPRLNIPGTPDNLI